MRRTSLHKLLSVLQIRRLNHFPPPRPVQTPTPPPNPKPCLTNPHSQSLFPTHRFYSAEGRSSSTLSSENVNKAVEEINLKFVEAREEIDLAMESKETVYFNEEALVAKEAVKEVLDMFDELLERVGDEEKGVLTRSMGMKIEQLKAELGQLEE